MIKEFGSVRVDLLGGTIDIEPINLVLKNAMTLNLATSLKAEVTIDKSSNGKIEIHSVDYDSTNSYTLDEFYQLETFGPLDLIVDIIKFFSPDKAFSLTLQSGSPAGAGLGGSSAMGITLFKAFSKFTKKTYSNHEAITIVKAIEAKNLDCGQTGYQDYYPAIYGGVLGLEAKYSGVKVHQLYSEELATFLEAHVTLVSSDLTRLSGINNWEVYQSFFNKDESVRKGLENISELSFKAFKAIKSRNFKDLLACIKEEGEIRESLFPSIVLPEVKSLYNELRADCPSLGMKVCGAGGGGCFLLVHEALDEGKLSTALSAHKMRKLQFKVERPAGE